MKYNDLQVKGPKSLKRVGRGIAAGQGKTAGRGTKGQNARTGSSKKPGFEGGQNPLMQRIPKLQGFRSYSTKSEVIYTGQLDQFAGKTVTSTQLAEHGLISNAHVVVKLLTKGEVSKKVTVKLQAASTSAVKAVEKAGGSFEKVAQEARIGKKIKTAK
jgi:large subunit ribosomal protein L15